MRKLFLSALFLGFSASLTAQDAPKYSNEFLGIGTGARALAMGGAFSSVADDVTSGYWNPAGLSRIRTNLQIGLMHSEYFAGIAQYEYAAIAAPVDATRTVGFTFIRYAIDDIIDSTDLIDKDGNINYDRLKTFSSADYAFLLSYSQHLTKVEGLLIGGNAKIIHRKVGDFAQAWGFGLDLGVQYLRDRWTFAAAGKDITSTFNAWTYNTEELEDVFLQTGNEIPQNGLELTLPRLILGANRDIPISEKIGFRPSLDLDITFDGERNVLIKTGFLSIEPKLGLEFDYDEFIFLRTGINNIQEVKNIDQSTSTTVSPSIGVGVKLKNLSIDYALTNFTSGSESLYSNVFSLRLNINRKTPKTTPPSNTPTE